MSDDLKNRIEFEMFWSTFEPQHTDWHRANLKKSRDEKWGYTGDADRGAFRMWNLMRASRPAADESAKPDMSKLIEMATDARYSNECIGNGFRLLMRNGSQPAPVASKEPTKDLEPFAVKFYVGNERPSIKGNGFDGLEIGIDREEAEGFVSFVNAVMASKEAVTLSDEHDAQRYRWLRDYSEPGICAFYLSVGMGLHGVRFKPETVDEAIDAQIAQRDASKAGGV